MKLLLIRHGESRGNVGRRWQGWLDEPLTERGVAQAHKLAARLAQWSQDQGVSIRAVHSSTLARAFQTGEILARRWGAPLILDGRLRERHVGVLEGLTWPEVEAQYPEIAEIVRQKWTVPALPGGETTHELMARIWQAITEIVERADGDGAVAVVSHGGAINAYLSRLAGRGHEEPFLFQLGNTSLSIVEMHHRRPRITLVNDRCHLDEKTPPADERTEDV